MPSLSVDFLGLVTRSLPRHSRISHQIQVFREARTLIEYKFISSSGQVDDRVDEIFADLEGYRNRDWERLVYVFYETARLVPEEKWAEQLKNHKSTEAVVVRGIPGLRQAQRKSRTAARNLRRISR
jgi:hypothetical protein